MFYVEERDRGKKRPQKKTKIIPHHCDIETENIIHNHNIRLKVAWRMLRIVIEAHP